MVRIDPAAYYSLAEVQKALAVSRNHLRKLRQLGLVRAARVGKRLLFSGASLESYLRTPVPVVKRRKRRKIPAGKRD